MFIDEEIPERQDPVAPALRSDAAKTNDATKRGAGGEPIHSFGTLLAHLGTLTRNTVEFSQGIQIEQLSVPTPLQRRVFDSLDHRFQSPLEVSGANQSTDPRQRT